MVKSAGQILADTSMNSIRSTKVVKITHDWCHTKVNESGASLGMYREGFGVKHS